MFAGNVGRVGRQTPMGGVGGASLPSLDLDFLRSETLDPRITFARGGTVATRFDSGGQLVTMGANTPRFDYDPSTATTNQMVLSENFITSWGSSSGVQVGYNNVAMSPRGDMTAGRIETGDLTNGAHVWFRTFTGGAVNTNYVASIYAKADQYPRFQLYLGNTAFGNINTGAVFDLTNGTVIATSNGSTATITPVGNGWYRVSITATSDADGGNYVIAIIPSPATVVAVGGTFTPASVGLGGFVWGTQVEVGTVMSSYIQTTGAVTAGNATPRGLLIEEARINSLPNSTMVGAAAGSPGTPPTGWTPAATGLTVECVATGTINGMAYVDYRFSGVAGTNFGQIPVVANGIVAAVNGQVWSPSAYIALVGGSFANVTSMTCSLNMNDVVPASIGSVTGISNFLGSITSTLTRFAGAGTLNQPTTAWLRMILGWGWPAASAIDFTIRIAAPQLELGTFATSFIPTSTVAVTRTQDLATMPLGSWFNSTNYSLYAEGSYPYAVGNAQQGIVVIDDGTANQRNTLRGLTPVGGINISFVVGGVATATANNGLTSPGVVFKSAYSAVSTGAVISSNGQAVVSGGGAMPTGLTTLRFGQNGAGAAFMDGHLRRVKVYPRALAPIELQSLTVL